MKRANRQQPPVKSEPAAPGEAGTVFILVDDTGCRSAVRIDGTTVSALVLNDRPGAHEECKALRDHLVATAPRGHVLHIVEPFLSASGWECSIEATAVTTSTWGVA